METGHQAKWLKAAIGSGASSLATTAVCSLILSHAGSATDPDQVLMLGVRLQSLLALPLTVLSFAAIAIAIRGEKQRGRAFVASLVVAVVSLLVFPAPMLALYYGIPKVL